MNEDAADVRLERSGDGTAHRPKQRRQRKRGNGREFEDDVYAWVCSDPRYTEIGREMRIRPRKALSPYRVDIVCVEYPESLAFWNRHLDRFAGWIMVAMFPGAGLINAYLNSRLALLTAGEFTRHGRRAAALASDDPLR